MGFYTILTERSVVRIEGEDRFKFLQGLLTNDVNKLKSNNVLYSCMLTPQGKYFADFFLYADNDIILLDVPTLRQEEILNKLNLYKLRSAITLVPCPEYKVIYFSSVPHVNDIVFADPRSKDLGIRGFISEHNFREITKDITHDDKAYDLVRINKFIAEGEKDLVPGKSFILEYGLDELNAVDYKKGCYVGQELIARTHHLGIIRKEIVRIEGEGDLPKLGSIIYSGEKKLGIICSSVYNKALALIRSEDVRALDPSAEIMIDGQKVKLIFKEERNA
jgi:tRNA-modifying protein YgfZ